MHVSVFLIEMLPPPNPPQTPEKPDFSGLLPVADCPTRWNSTEAMMSRGLQIKNAVNEVLAMPEWEKKVGLKFSARHWDTIEKVVSVLKVTSYFECHVYLFLQDFLSATEQLSSASACISEVSSMKCYIYLSLPSLGYSHCGRAEDQTKQGLPCLRWGPGVEEGAPDSLGRQAGLGGGGGDLLLRYTAGP